jgi:hypothetical protein
MNTVMKIFIATVLLISLQTRAQEIIRPGLVRTSFTISPSYVFGAKEANFHFEGSHDIFLSEKFSLAGGGYFFLGKLGGGTSVFDYNHSLFWGGNFHWKRGNSDFYLGFQPGISITKLDMERNDLVENRRGVNPIFSSVAGFNQFISPNFHFFVQSRFVVGNHGYDKQMNINELKFSAGLGFNLNASKD